MRLLHKFSTGKMFIGTALLAGLIVYFFKPTHSSVNLSDMNIKPNEELSLLKDQMYVSVDVNNLSSLSLRLLVAGLWGEEEEYLRAKSHMLQLLEIDPPLDKPGMQTIANNIDAQQAWMLGRMLIAAWYIQDKDMTHHASEIMSMYLARPDVDSAPNAMTVWASGYLLEYDAQVAVNQYHKTVNHRLANANVAIETAKKEQAISTITWIHVVNLYAAAVAKDSEHYAEIKTALGHEGVLGGGTEEAAITDQNILAALEHIPETDFRAWAYMWTLRAAASAKDHALLEVLNAKADMILEADIQALMQATDALRAAPEDKTLQGLQETLRNDYVLGASNRLYVTGGK